jgi:hypothetical protein
MVTSILCSTSRLTSKSVKIGAATIEITPLNISAAVRDLRSWPTAVVSQENRAYRCHFQYGGSKDVNPRVEELCAARVEAKTNAT